MHTETNDDNNGESEKNPISEFRDIPGVLEGRDHDI
jgi:hypothetical protein